MLEISLNCTYAAHAAENNGGAGVETQFRHRRAASQSLPPEGGENFCNISAFTALLRQKTEPFSVPAAMLWHNNSGICLQTINHLLGGRTMKRILGLSTLAALLIAPCMAQAETGLYVAPKLIYGNLQGYDVKGGEGDKVSLGSDNVFGGGIAVGYDFNKQFKLPLRTELEYAAFNNAKGKHEYNFLYDSNPDASISGTARISIGVKTLFANAYYDFRNDSKFTPYVGLGLGWSFMDVKVKDTWTDVYPPWPTEYGSESTKKSSTSFAWNASGGVGYALTSNINLDLAYRFARLGKATVDSDSDGKVKTSNLDMHQVLFGVRVAF
jgi:opacity protein-like surface antigen